MIDHDDLITEIEAVLVDLRTDVGYALVQLGPIAGEDRARRAMDALARVQTALADLTPAVECEPQPVQ